MSDEMQTPGASDADATAVGTAEFAQSIGDTPDEQLREGMAGPLRDQILDEIFGRMQEHFDSDAAAGVDAVIHWRIRGRADGGADEFEVVINQGHCTSRRGLQAGDPRVAFSVDGADFLKLVTGNAHGPELFMSGRLAIEGDLMFAPRINSLFTAPGA